MPTTRGYRNYLIRLPNQLGQFCISAGCLCRRKRTEKRRRISVNGLELPVFIQPGQAKDTISVALGYGREVSGKVGDKTGKNMYPFVGSVNGSRQYFVIGAKVEKVSGKTFELAISQTHYSMEGRPIVREATLGRLHQKSGFRK